MIEEYFEELDETLRVVCEHERIPMYQTEGSAGLDLHVAETTALSRFMVAKVGTGLRVALPIGTVGLILPRSSITKKGIMVHIGTIDEDYRGELCLLLSSLEPAIVRAGERVAQLVILPVLRARVMPVERLDETVRGENGFGSTGFR